MGKRSKARAVFLDRDGVINMPIIRNGKSYPPHRLEDFQIYAEAFEACRRLKEAAFLLIIVTNQPDVGRRILEQGVVEAMHRMMCRQLSIDDVEICYASGEEEKEDFFRKPLPGMVMRAAKKHSLDLPRSFMVGDRWRDVECGYAAGCKTVFIDRGYSEPLKREPHYRVSNLLEAADIILNENQK